MNRNSTFRHPEQSGVILLVVLGALTFFSVLIAAYLVFSNQSRAASFALAQRSTRAPDVNWLMNEALMNFVRGTSDVNSPFYGEDMLSDFYGHDGMSLQVKHVNSFGDGPVFIGNGFVRFPISTNGTFRPGNVDALDDVYTGSLLTFRQGDLQDMTFRVLRSTYHAAIPPVPPSTTTIAEYDNVYIELPEGILNLSSSTLLEDVRSLFYSDPTNLTTGGVSIHMNGVPLNSPGIGFDGTNISGMIGSILTLQQPQDPSSPLDTDTLSSTYNPAIGYSLPIALQPNHIGRNVDKSTTTGDFDEPYDSPDYNNWYLSHRRADGSVIPSFHRPSVINYIINQETDWSSISTQDLMATIARSTFRPIPIASGQLAVSSDAVDARFTGGSNEFALRTALPVNGRTGLLNQLLESLINPANGWDVDNDADGVADSVWIDLGLPTFTSSEGKLIRPLVAPMIEDMSARLNLNAHGNSQLSTNDASVSATGANWAGTLNAFDDPANARTVFRGIGWGPSEVMLPGVSTTGIINATMRTELATLLNDRYRYGAQPLTTPDFPGENTRDTADALRFGYRPIFHSSNGGFGYSTDPFGRGGIALGRSGSILSATPTSSVVNEAVNNPYESDPSGELSGDRAFTFGDLEAVLRANDFDSELLPRPLRDRLGTLVDSFPEFSSSFTTRSGSYDGAPAATVPTPASATAWIRDTAYVVGDFVTLPNGRHLRCIATTGTGLSEDSDYAPTGPGVDNEVTWEAVFPGSAYLSIVNLIKQLIPASYTQAQWNQLLPPELRLGRKLDVNRRFGNLVDDNANGVIDEPLETARADADSADNDGDGTMDELGEVLGETEAHKVANSSLGTVPTSFAIGPNYTFDEPRGAAADIPVSGRQLLARHLYVLAMTLSRDLDAPATEAEFPSSHDPAPASFVGSKYKARRLAQWAVNVVDYRDPDSINTRFVFDETPFDATGWSPPADTAAAPAASDHVVWGVEEPSLVFSESMAFHDVRLRDTARDDGENQQKGTMPGDDDDSDSVRMPQGSLILELYCNHPVVTVADQATKPGAPQEVFNSTPELDLAATAPPTSGTLGAPVWRIAITSRHDATSANAASDPQNVRDTIPDSASFEITNPDEVDSASGALTYDRFIWFQDATNTDTDPDAAFTLIGNRITANGISDTVASQVFVAPTFSGDAVTNADKTLQPGQFLVLAPRLDTQLGSKEFAAAVPGLPSDQRFEVNYSEGGLLQHNHSATRLTPNLSGGTNPYTAALPLVIAAPRPTGWTIPSAANPNLPNNVVGLSVSEPLSRGIGGYYPQPSQRYNGSQDVNSDMIEDYLLTDAYIDFSDPATNSRDTPLDTDTTLAFGRIPAIGLEPALGTISRYCSAFLQRLADPTRPYDSITNPYRTIDWIPIDLHVFSGEDRAANITGTNPDYTRRSRQRNGFVRPVPVNTSTAVAANALFSYETDFNDSEATKLDTTVDEFFQFDPGLAPIGPEDTTHLQSSFSFLNTQTTNINPGFIGFSASVGALGTAGAIVDNDRNLPQTPYSKHPWLNRPYASHLELLMVPACSQGRLFEEFSFDPAADLPIYPSTATPADPTVSNAPFRHLLNFFHSSSTGGSSMELARLFDFVHTLPRFRGEVSLINPLRLTSTVATEETELAIMRSIMQAPFTSQYDNHRQATINLNTLSQFPVWAGLMQGHLNDAEFTTSTGTIGSADQLSFDNFLESRRGFPIFPAATPSTVATTGPFNYDPANLDPRFPTEFAGVYASGVATPKAMSLRTAADTALMRRRPVNGTLLRGSGNMDENDGTATPIEASMFVRASSASTNVTVQTPDPATNAEHDRRRNPFMRYQTLMRMPNLTSNNSQVFLLRFTLGFFEVDAQTQSLQREYNADISQNQRYTALFVIDRSIPVGFIPGQDLNARDVVIFESYGQ